MGLDQKRLHHINFKGGIFTNFSQDHLDYHKNMKTILIQNSYYLERFLDKKSTIISDKKIRPFNILKKFQKGEI